MSKSKKSVAAPSKDTTAYEHHHHKVNHKKVKSGDLMAIVNYVKVKGISNGGAIIQVENMGDGAPEFRVEGADLVSNMFSADQYEEEILVSRTRAIEALITAYNRPLTVYFIKKDGSDRVLRGRFLNEVPHEGRSYCEDFDVIGPAAARIREVDNRTLQYVIVDGIKYTVK